jgi:hypothetical protein
VLDQMFMFMYEETRDVGRSLDMSPSSLFSSEKLVTGVLVLAKTGLNQSAILLHFCVKRIFRRIALVEGARGSPLEKE